MMIMSSWCKQNQLDFPGTSCTRCFQ